MLKYLLLFFLLSEPLKGPELSFTTKRILDLGNVKEGEIVTAIVAIKNTGDEDLQIISAIPTCNCTSVRYPREPIPAGTSQNVEIKVDTKGREGKETVVVKLLSNTKQQYSVVRVDFIVNDR